MQIQHKAGRYLLENALGREVFEHAEFALGEHGKPYIVDSPVHYNISHSGGYAVLVTASCEVGVDIQECKTVRKEQIARRFFTEEEWETVEQESDLFYRIWCRKEAYGKYLGVGLTEAVLRTNVLREIVPASDALYPDMEQQKNYKFHDLNHSEGYQISICSRKDESIEKIVCVFEGL